MGYSESESSAARVVAAGLLVLLSILTAGTPRSALAQSRGTGLCGRVVDADGPLPEVIVTLLEGKEGDMVAYALTNEEGRFCLEHESLPHADSLTLRVAAMTYETRILRLPSDRVREPLPLPDIEMKAAPMLLSEVVSRAPAITGHRDTINYNTELLRRKEDHSVEDLLRRLPGIEVSSDGLIRYLGRPITRVMIEDLDMLGGQYRLATRNISPDMVAQIQVYEHDQPIKVRRNLERTENAAINLKLKDKVKLRPILYAEAKAGTGCRPLLYEGQAFRLRIARSQQNLEVAKADNSGHNGGEDFVPILPGVSAAPGLEMRQLVSQPSMGEVPLPRSYYDYNGDLAASAHTISRIRQGRDELLSAGLTLSDTRRDTYGQRSTRYTVGGQTVDINEADHALKHERQALLRVKYERNLDRLYLMDELTGSWSRQDAHHLLQGGSPLQMLSEHDEWYLSNKLIHTLRRKDNLYTLSSDIYVGGIPSAHTSVTPDDEEGTERGQQLSGLSVRTDHRYELRISLPHRWSLEMGPGMALDVDRLYTAYSEMGREQVNDLTLTRLRPYILLKWRLEHSMSETEVETPIMGEYTRLDRAETTGLRQLRWVPTLSVRHTQRWSPLWSTTLRGRVKRQSGELLRHLTAPVMTSYRSMTVVDATSDPEQWSFSASLGTRYRDPIAARSGHATLTYVGSRQNLLRSEQIDPDFSSESYISGVSLRHFITLGSGLSLGVDDRLESVLSLDLSAIMGRNSVIRNNHPLTLSSQTFTLSPSYRYTPSEGLMSGWVTLSYTASRFHLSMEGGPTSAAEEIPQELDIRSGVTLKPGDWEITATLLGRGIWSNLRPLRMVPIGDLSLRYSRGSSAPEYSVNLRNLFDKTDYRTESYAGADYVASSYRLRGRELLAGVRWSF